MQTFRFFIVQAADVFSLASICAGIVVTTVFFALTFII